MSERKEKQSMYDKLNDEQKSAQIPYYVHEMEMTRLERINKRLWILILIVFLALIGTNAGWIIYESQFQSEEYSYEVTQDSGAGGENTYTGMAAIPTAVGATCAPAAISAVAWMTTVIPATTPWSTSTPCGIVGTKNSTCFSDKAAPKGAVFYVGSSVGSRHIFLCILLYFWNFQRKRKIPANR